MRLLTSALSLSLLAACAPKAGVAPQAPAPPELIQFTSADAGFHTNSWWMDTGEQVVVFDAQFTNALADQLIADIQAQTESPITTLVVTHPNPDKFNGATAFQELGAEVIASQATADAMPGVHDYKRAYFVGAGMFTEDSYPPLPQIDRVFQDSLSLELDGVDLRLMVLDNPGVTDTQTVALLDGAAVVGDLVASETHAWLEGAIVDGRAAPDTQGWQAALSELQEQLPADALVLPGRGPAAPASQVLPAQTAYLDHAQALVMDYLDTLDDPMGALTGPDAGAHYAALGADFEAAWPEHAHSYLITYGVYGLALQLAQ